MSSLRFCMLTTFYPPFNFGGDGIDVQKIARALVRRGHQVTVIHDVDAYRSLAARDLPASPVSQDGVEVIDLRSRVGTLSPLLTHQFGRPVVHGRRIERLIRERMADAIIFNNVSLVGGPGLLSAGGSELRIYVAHEHWLVCPTHVLWRFNREPCDHRVCTRCVLSYHRPLQPWRYTSFLERQLSHVDLFLARSEFSRERHRQFGFRPAMEVFPSFVPGTIPETPVPPSGDRPHERPYFLFVGRLTKIKGLASIIPAVARYPDADLLVVGDGDEAAALKGLAKELKNVRFVGHVPNDELPAYYAHAIGVIVPTLGYETFGMVLIEALRQRTPVIARRIGPLPEVVELSRGGLLFDDNDELLNAMGRLQRDFALRESLAANGYDACRQYWSEDVVIGRFLEMTTDAMNAKRAGASRRPG